MQVTTKDVKKEDRFCMKSKLPEGSVQRMFFKFNPYFCGSIFKYINTLGQGQSQRNST